MMPPSRRDILRMAAAAGVASVAAAADAGQEASNHEKRQEYEIIDVHCHPRWLGHNGRRMVENMDSLGIKKAWLLSWEAPASEISPAYHDRLNPLALKIRFEDVIAVSEAYPDRFIPGTTMDPRDPYAPQKLKSAVEIFGVRVFGEFKRRLRYDNPDCLRLFRVCGDLGLPVLFHLDVVLPVGSVQRSWQWWYGGDIHAVEAALKACPGTVFIGHAPGFWREISGDADQETASYPAGKPVKPGGRLLRLLDTYENLYCDISAGSGYTALTRDLDFTRKFLVDYQDRILFGRDEFSSRHLDLLFSLNLPQPVLRKILGDNARRLVSA